VTAGFGIDEALEALAERILRAAEERARRLPRGAAERVAEAGRRAEEALAEWMAELQRCDLAPPLSEGGRRLVALAAMLAARLLHEIAGDLKLLGVPEGAAIGLAIDRSFSARAKIVVAASLGALAKYAERAAEEGGGDRL
jgi:hypothetical protein